MTLEPPLIHFFELQVVSMSTENGNGSKLEFLLGYNLPRVRIHHNAVNQHSFGTTNTDYNEPVITKTYLYNFDPHKPHFLYGKTGVYRAILYISYFCSKHRLWYSLEPPHRVPTIFVLSRNMKNIEKIYLIFFFHFLVVKFSIYLNRHVFVMEIPINDAVFKIQTIYLTVIYFLKTHLFLLWLDTHPPPPRPTPPTTTTPHTLISPNIQS